MIKLFVSFLFSLSLTLICALSAWGTFQELRGLLAGWFVSNDSVQKATLMLWRQASFGLVALLFAVGFALIFIVSAYIHMAYAAYLQES